MLMPPDSFMLQAIDLARQAQALGEVPIGCVLVHDPTNRVIGRGFNRRQIDNDPTAHAEILALREAAVAIGNYRLPESDIYCTLEPCAMCAGALVNARVRRLIFGARDLR